MRSSGTAKMEAIDPRSAAERALSSSHRSKAYRRTMNQSALTTTRPGTAFMVSRSSLLADLSVASSLGSPIDHLQLLAQYAVDPTIPNVLGCGLTHASPRTASRSASAA